MNDVTALILACLPTEPYCAARPIVDAFAPRRKGSVIWAKT